MRTFICDVKGSSPVAPEAKLTPVIKSLSLMRGSMYAGTYSLIFKISAENEITEIIIDRII